jgi:hypothetical protein
MRFPARRGQRAAIGLALAASLLGCRPAAPSETPAPSEAANSAAEPAPVEDSEPALHVHLTPTLRPSPQVEVRLELRGPGEAPDEALRVWSLPGPLAGPLSPTVRDAEGPIELSVTPAADDPEGVVVRLARAPTLPLEISYSLAPASAELGEFARLELDDSYFFATGEALLLLPDAALDRRLRLGLHLDPAVLGPTDPSELTGLPPVRAASSFAAEAEHELDGWIFELRRAAFAMGQLEWARFDSMAGDDRWLGAGVTRFDHRWSAAELAGVRSAIDRTIGMPTLDPLVTLLLGGPRTPAEPVFRAQLRGRGLVILADEGASWDAQARMVVAQALAARWLGGRVRVHVEPPSSAASEGAEPVPRGELWFQAGATRHVAREVLFEFGLLDDEEYLDELNRLELELATSPLRERSFDELVALLAAGEVSEADPGARRLAADARAQLIARGAVFLAWLDQRIRSSGELYSRYGVAEALRTLIAKAVASERRDLGLGELLAEAGELIDGDAPPLAELRAAFDATVLAGRRPPLGAGAFGPCFRPRQTKLRRFELGFVDLSAPGGLRPNIAALAPAGPAVAAGLREDDEILSLAYLAGDPETPVELTVRRGDEIVDLRYMPAGPKLRGVQWSRDPRVPALECVR